MRQKKIAPYTKLHEPEEESGHFILRLYIAGHTPRSRRAVENLKRIVTEYLPAETDLEVIDIYQQGHMAREANVIGAPTLVKYAPPPLKRFLGDLSDENKVLHGLNLKPTGA